MPLPDSPGPHPATGPEKLAGPVLAALAEAVGKLRFGVVQLTVHEGRVVQLEVTEKHRF
jgi:hypothetical protein